MSEWIPEEEWATIVKHAPIVSVDLVVECPDGIVLGQRANEPAKGEWFVPGGRVQKGETLEAAVHRVAMAELDADITIQHSLGAFDHFYDTSEVGYDKHYVAHGFYVRTDATAFESDAQHEGVTAFAELPADLHPYVQAYLEAAGVW
ncbi:NUDIX domain-containing protein [Natronomonas gomsonensis]|uniref:NUDIX domain-containing protein n=1 Tax=Natronomonas gomsonensis TaxID=1046043 RepID=UPI00227D4CDB|nr:NUDIX domain-containing protein [Natronomonas gomsonensis]MCY4732528.1 NUDIX domain-containing protein [Natronomonas gomsonensis]